MAKVSAKSKAAAKTVGRKVSPRKASKNIVVESMKAVPLAQQNVELVERKGIGHPDSISDGIAEAVSLALCKMYLERFGEILHHNTDQNEVVGGQSTPRFGGGEVLEPIHIMLSGRACPTAPPPSTPRRNISSASPTSMSTATSPWTAASGRVPST